MILKLCSIMVENTGTAGDTSHFGKQTDTFSGSNPSAGTKVVRATMFHKAGALGNSTTQVPKI